MKKPLLSLAFATALSISGFAQSEAENVTEADTLDASAFQNQIMEALAIDSSFTYQYGKVDISNGLATLNVPEGYKFLDAEQSQYVLSDLWGNPPDESTLGMLFREEDSPILGNLYAIEISYSDDGYIEDDDAADLDYAELMEELQQDTEEENGMRVAQGYPSVSLVGWAAEPYYDTNTKKLHWAKEIAFDGEEENTLNYNIRILGRNGYLMLNAISEINALDSVNADIEPILASVNFNEGNRYSDFDSSIDKVAAYGVGGLIAGKILSKVGFFAVLAKFWKFIFLGIAGLFGAFKKKIFGSSEA